VRQKITLSSLFSFSSLNKSVGRENKLLAHADNLSLAANSQLLAFRLLKTTKPLLFKQLQHLQ